MKARQLLHMAMMVLLLYATVSVIIPQSANAATLQPEVENYVRVSMNQFGQIPEDRRRQLKKIALFVRSRIDSARPADLTFICTHNSRRSHMSQIWAQVAASVYGIPHVTTYSGGTEATAFNRRTVEALKRSGLTIKKTTAAENPVYHVYYSATSPPLTSFSKVYNSAPNPSKGFVAVMTCDQADKNCPTVQGAALRVAIPYVDPKVHDGTDREAQAYDERSRQISREMLYMMSEVKRQ
jgi:protein-tyrosine-phosphatase